MPETGTDLLTFVLTQCQAAAPEPWYPSSYSGAGMARDQLDKALDALRLNNLIRLTDWVKGKGQGYTLTASGEEVMRSPRLLKRLREGKVPSPSAEEEVVERDNERPTPWQRGEAVRAVWLNPLNPFVSRVLLWMNLGVFAWGAGLALQRDIPLNRYLETRALGMGGAPDRDTIEVAKIRYETGAVWTPLVVDAKQWWRLLTYMFVHGGIIHLAMNMTCLYTMGSVLETMWGRFGFLILYVVSGLGGGLGIVWAGSAGVGASGALSGLLVSPGVWLLLNWHHVPREAAGRFAQNIGFNLLLLVFISMLPGISWQGHLGGAVAGAAVALPLVYWRYTSGFQRTLGVAGVVVVCLVVVGLAAGLTTGHISPF